MKCGWGKKSCSREAVCETESLLGNWTPCCKYHLEQKKRLHRTNDWSAIFPLKIRELSTPLKEK